MKGFTSPEDFQIKETAIDYGDGSSYQVIIIKKCGIGNITALYTRTAAALKS